MNIISHYPIWFSQNLVPLGNSYFLRILINILFGFLQLLFFDLNAIIHRFYSHLGNILNYIYLNIYNINEYQILLGLGV